MKELLYYHDLKKEARKDEKKEGWNEDRKEKKKLTG